MSTTISDSRREFLRKLAAVSVILPGADILEYDPYRNEKNVANIKKIKKIDAHMHISSDAAYLREVMDELNLKMFTICNIGVQLDRLKTQIEAAIDISNKYPRYFAWCTTFGFDHMYQSDWPDRVKEFLKNGFDNGALAVKVWKEIGMQVKTPEGMFVQIDDPVFEPILDYIKQEGKPLYAHIGDPVTCWLSAGPDGKQNYWYEEGAGITRNRIGAFRGEVSYDKLILARDRMLSKNPDLKVIGCHMGSMAFDLDEVADRLKRYPNFAVDTSLSVPYLMGQAREKVREFFITYQDRILYGLDESGGMIPTHYLKDMSKLGQEWTKDEVVKEKKRLLDRYDHDFIYYSTDHKIKKGNYYINGLALPDEVLGKIFYSNAVRWVPGINKAFQ